MKHKILIIDDSALDLAGIEFLLEGSDFHVKATTDSEEGIAFVRQNRGAVSLAIIDYNMPGQNGAKVAEILSALDPKLQIATYSGDTSPNAFGETLSAGSQYFIPKGLEPERLLAIVKMFCGRFEDANKTIKIEPVSVGDVAKINSMGLIGISRHLLEVSELIQSYAPQTEIVLITGENGTGKEKVARALHAHSGRRGPFIPVNCGAIPADLLESELFGHEKGAFSGAVRAKIGLVSAANNGTIFLDEIGDLPLLLQVKLLRFLQESEVRPVGSNQAEKVNTRVLVATNVNLDEAVRAGRFRQDLFYRIKGLPIDLLPLRKRPEDIRPLVHRFSRVVAKEKGIEKEFLEETVKVMMRHEWPGNVRELEHEVKRVMLLAKGNTITPEDIDPKIHDAIEKATFGALSASTDYQTFKDQQRLRNESEERSFLAEKSKSAKSIRELARDILKVSNSTLQGRLKLLGIEFVNSNQNKGEKEYETI